MQEDYVFIDFEASGLMPGSYPIEIGWAIASRHDDTIVTGSKLIRNDDWLDELHLWDYQAEDVHKINRNGLMMLGVSPVSAILAFEKAIDGRTLVLSDAPSYDGRWLHMLYDAAGRTCPVRVDNWSIAFDSEDTDERKFEYYSKPHVLEKIAPHTHRAEQDALSMATLWRLTRRQSGYTPKTF